MQKIKIINNKNENENKAIFSNTLKSLYRKVHKSMDRGEGEVLKLKF